MFSFQELSIYIRFLSLSLQIITLFFSLLHSHSSSFYEFCKAWILPLLIVVMFHLQLHCHFGRAINYSQFRFACSSFFSNPSLLLFTFSFLWNPNLLFYFLSGVHVLKLKYGTSRLSKTCSQNNMIQPHNQSMLPLTNILLL